MALSDARAKRIARLHRRKSRRREGLVLVEGPRAVRAALDAGVDPRFAVISPRLFDVDPGLAERLLLATEVVQVIDAEMGPLADTTENRHDQTDPRRHRSAPGSSDGGRGARRHLVR